MTVTDHGVLWAAASPLLAVHSLLPRQCSEGQLSSQPGRRDPQATSRCLTLFSPSALIDRKPLRPLDTVLWYFVKV